MAAPDRTPTNPGVMISGSGGAPLTVGDIRNAIHDLENDVEIMFGSTLAGTPLVFYRFKIRGDKLLQIELNEDDGS